MGSAGALGDSVAEKIHHASILRCGIGMRRIGRCNKSTHGGLDRFCMNGIFGIPQTDALSHKQKYRRETPCAFLESGESQYAVCDYVPHILVRTPACFPFLEIAVMLFPTLAMTASFWLFMGRS